MLVYAMNSAAAEDSPSFASLHKSKITNPVQSELNSVTPGNLWLRVIDILKNPFAKSSARDWSIAMGAPFDAGKVLRDGSFGYSRKYALPGDEDLAISAIDGSDEILISVEWGEHEHPNLTRHCQNFESMRAELAELDWDLYNVISLPGGGSATFFTKNSIAISKADNTSPSVFDHHSMFVVLGYRDTIQIGKSPSCISNFSVGVPNVW